MGEFETAVEQVDKVGYYRLRGVYEKQDVELALKKVRSYYELTRDNILNNVPYLNIDQPTVYNLQSKDCYFTHLLFKPRVMERILIHYLNDPWYKQIPQDKPNYLLRSYVARSSNKELPMHIDSFVPYLGDYVFVVQYSIILQDQDASNGCTVVVPGSHLAGEYTTQEARKRAVPIESKAGDVVIWDSRLWHGTAENLSGQTRWAIVATFCRWWIKQHFNLTQTMPQEIYEKLTDAQKAVLGYCTIPQWDETTGIDIKRGYDSLAQDVRTYRQELSGSI